MVYYGVSTLFRSITMPRPRKKNPSYRLHKPTGQAVVTLSDPQSGKRKDFYLGEHGSPDSHKRYAEILQAHHEHGQVIDAQPQPLKPVQAEDTVTSVLLAFWQAEKRRFGIKDGEKITGHLAPKRWL